MIDNIEAMVGDVKEKFFLDKEDIAYDDKGNVYDVYKSESNRHTTGFGTMGFIRLIVSGEKVLAQALPLFSPPKPYTKTFFIREGFKKRKR
jgi:hypothetical protein